MTIDDDALARSHTDALAGLDVNHLKRSQTLHLDNAVGFQTFLNNLEHHGDKLIGLLLVEIILLLQDSSNLLYSQFTHTTCYLLSAYLSTSDWV